MWKGGFLSPPIYYIFFIVFLKTHHNAIQNIARCIVMCSNVEMSHKFCSDVVRDISICLFATLCDTILKKKGIVKKPLNLL